MVHLHHSLDLTQHLANIKIKGQELQVAKYEQVTFSDRPQRLQGEKAGSKAEQNKLNGQ